MLPARKFFGQSFMPDFFGDLFENVNMDGRVLKAPAINVIEDDEKYCLELAAPGLSKDDFKVHVNRDGNLVIEMEKKDCECKGKDEDKKECRFLRKEFSYSKFSQTLLLPDNADKEGIEAQVNNGILKVTIPKQEKTKAEDTKREIEVK